MNATNTSLALEEALRRTEQFLLQERERAGLSNEPLPARRLAPEWEDLTTTVGVEVFRRMILDEIPGYIELPSTRRAMIKLVSWVIGDESFGVNLGKGILLKGCTGSGKSTLIRLLWKFSKLVGATFPHYSGETQHVSYKPLLWMERKADYWTQSYQKTGVIEHLYLPVLNIDDLGTETQARHYGSDTVNPVAQLLLNRCDLGSDYLLVATTNLTESQMNSRYDDRVMSRLMGASNSIDLEGYDHRSKD